MVVGTGGYVLPSLHYRHGKISSWWWKRIKGPPIYAICCYLEPRLQLVANINHHQNSPIVCLGDVVEAQNPKPDLSLKLPLMFQDCLWASFWV